MPSSDVPAADATLRILRHLSRTGPTPATALARAVGLPRSTTYHLLAVLREHGLVAHLPEERRYGLGLGAFELGSAYSRQAPLARAARPVLARLVDQVGESAHLAVLHGREVLYVVEERALRRPPLVTDVGVRLPAHLTASGRAMLAALPRPQVRALFPDRAAFVDRTGLGPTRPAELRDLLVEVRRRGWAAEDGDVTPGFASVGVAVRDHTGHPIAGLAVTFARADVDDAAAGTLAQAAHRAAADLSRRVGGAD
nr:IclR family transcriptional regulator [Cellulomonas fimi]